MNNPTMKYTVYCKIHYVLYNYYRHVDPKMTGRSLCHHFTVLQRFDHFNQKQLRKGTSFRFTVVTQL